MSSFDVCHLTLSWTYKRVHGVPYRLQDGRSALHVAAEAGRLEAVRMLLTEGKADPTVRNKVCS